VGTLESHLAVEQAARSSYGRLLALLAAGTGDLQLAQDALSTALERALTTWPGKGVPASPEAWLLTVARNAQKDVWKSAAFRTSTGLEAALELTTQDPVRELPDERLELLFVCAHPALAENVRTPLVLNAVLGFEAAEIGRAFAVPGSTMAQRLVRAKRRIRDTRFRFATPPPTELPERIPTVLEAVYGTLALGWTDEARYLSRALAELLRSRGLDEPEAWGLAALTHLRDTSELGEEFLRRARGVPGRFALEAAILAVHRSKGSDGELLTLYRALNSLAPTLGSLVAQAAVRARVDGPDAGLLELDALSGQRFQPWWATRAHLLAGAGRDADAVAAYERAAALSTDDDTRAWLLDRRPLSSPHER